MKQVYIGWGFAAAVGAVLVVSSLQVRSSPECGFLISLSSLCGSDAGGAPAPFLGRQVDILAIAIDWLYWAFPLLLLATGFSLLWRSPRLRTSATAWVTESLVLLPAAIWSIAYSWESAQLPAVPWFEALLALPGHVTISPSYLLVGMTDRPMHMAFLAYIMLVFFTSIWWCTALKFYDGLWRLPLFLFAIIMTALPFAMYRTDWYAAQFIKPDEYPFKILRLVQNPQNGSVNFELRFLKLPSSNEIYEVRYFVEPEEQPGSVSIGEGDHIDYLRYDDHNIYKYKPMQNVAEFQGPFEQNATVSGYIIWDGEYQPVHYFDVVVRDVKSQSLSAPDLKFYVIPIH